MMERFFFDTQIQNMGVSLIHDNKIKMGVVPLKYLVPKFYVQVPIKKVRDGHFVRENFFNKYVRIKTIFNIRKDLIESSSEDRMPWKPIITDDISSVFVTKHKNETFLNIYYADDFFFVNIYQKYRNEFTIQEWFNSKVYNNYIKFIKRFLKLFIYNFKLSMGYEIVNPVTDVNFKSKRNCNKPRMEDINDIYILNGTSKEINKSLLIYYNCNGGINLRIENDTVGFGETIKKKHPIYQTFSFYPPFKLDIKEKMNCCWYYDEKLKRICKMDDIVIEQKIVQIY